MKAVLGTGAVLRVVATLGIAPTVYVDSAEYRGVALFGGNRRPWTVPLLHAAVGDGTARVLAHAVLGAAAWCALAFVVARGLRHRAAQVVTSAAVMGTGLTTSVANYDATITSETVAVSLAVALFAAWLHLASAPTPRAGVLLVLSAVLFTFTRNDHPLLIAASALPAALVAVRLRSRVWAGVAAALVVVAAWGIAAAERNDEIARFNLAMVMANRIVPDPELLDWFVDDGMPLPDEAGKPGTDTTLAFASDRAWNRWASDEGRLTYARFLLTHPHHLLLEPWPDVLGVRSTSLEVRPRPTVLLSPGDAYGRVHRVLPGAVESLLWGPDDAGALTVAVAGLAAVAVLRGGWRDLRRPSRAVTRLGPARCVAAGALVLAAGHLLLVWHASPIELGRLAMVPATLVHVGVLVLVAETADRQIVPNFPIGQTRTNARPTTTSKSMGP